MGQELEALTVAQLRDLAKELGITGYSRLSRSSLLEVCAAAQAGDPLPAVSPVAEGLPQTSLVEDGPAPYSSPGEPVPDERVLRTDEPFTFPASYGVDRLALMVRDPQWMFCYWDISADTWARVQGDGLADPANGWRRVLRLHDMTGTVGGEPSDQTLVSDLDLGPDARDFYLQAPAPDRVYLVEYGYLSSTGEFIRLIISNLVNVPRSTPSDQIDEAWGSLYDEALRLSLAGGQLTSEAGLPGSADTPRGLFDLLSERLSSGPFSASVGGGRSTN